MNGDAARPVTYLIQNKPSVSTTSSSSRTDRHHNHHDTGGGDDIDDDARFPRTVRFSQQHSEAQRVLNDALDDFERVHRGSDATDDTAPHHAIPSGANPRRDRPPHVGDTGGGGGGGGRAGEDVSGDQLRRRKLALRDNPTYEFASIIAATSNTDIKTLFVDPSENDILRTNRTAITWQHFTDDRATEFFDTNPVRHETDDGDADEDDFGGDDEDGGGSATRTGDKQRRTTNGHKPSSTSHKASGAWTRGDDLAGDTPGRSDLRTAGFRHITIQPAITADDDVAHRRPDRTRKRHRDGAHDSVEVDVDLLESSVWAVILSTMSIMRTRLGIQDSVPAHTLVEAAIRSDIVRPMFARLCAYQIIVNRLNSGVAYSRRERASNMGLFTSQMRSIEYSIGYDMRKREFYRLA